MSDSGSLTIPNLLERAALALRLGDLPRAELVCKAILLARPDTRDALHFMGVIAHRRGRNDEALRHIDRALALGLTSAQVHANRGTVLCGLSRFAEALVDLDRALSLDPGAADVLCNRGLALHELSRFGEARDSFMAALAIKPSAQAHAGLAGALCELGRYDDAVRHEDIGLSLRGDWNNRMDHLVTQGRHAEAVALLDEAIPPALRQESRPPVRIVSPVRRIVVDRGHHLMHPADADDLAAVCGRPVRVVDLANTDPADFGSGPDTLVIYSHGILMARSGTMRKIKKAAPHCPVVAWGFANHTAYLANVMLAAAADIMFPSHVTPIDYLARWNRGPVVPLALFQWPAAELRALYQVTRDEPRSDVLSGHFSLYAAAPARNRLVADAIQRWPEADLTLRRGWRYHQRSPLDRFLTWRRRKTSLVLPVHGDLSMRFFDALAAGQVPIVARDILDFDRVIPPADQSRLPIVRLEGYDLDSLRAAHAKAIAAFDRGGEEGAKARHDFVLEHHMLAHRIRDIADHVNGLAEGDGTFAPPGSRR